MTSLLAKAIAAGLCAFVVLAASFTPERARALEPGEMLSDPALEARARNISAGLRCLVCQNQSIDDSDAELARDLRTIVRQRLQAGDSDEQVLKFIVDRYGTFVLLKPPLSTNTLLLWLTPLLFLIPGFFFYWRLQQQGEQPYSSPPPLSAAERKDLDHILETDRRL